VIVAFDFFTVPAVTFDLLYCFFVIEHGRRRILHFNVTRHPTADWVIQQLREAFPEAAPYRYVIMDRDSKFDEEVITFLKATGLEPRRTSIRSPWQNGLAERRERNGDFHSPPGWSAPLRVAPGGIEALSASEISLRYGRCGNPQREHCAPKGVSARNVTTAERSRNVSKPFRRVSAGILLASALLQYGSNYIGRERRPTRRIRFWLPAPADRLRKVPSGHPDFDEMR
jgi:hypothetical protein